MTGLTPVCILTAGKGTRMGSFADTINKALLPLGDRAILSHIINRFPVGTEFVIALGYLANQVRHYLAMAHSDLVVRFVDVDVYQGEGSGPGYSLWCCREQLQRPFYFVACDTLFDGDLAAAPQGNWMGVAVVDPAVSSAYCNCTVQEGRITEIRDKQACDATYRAFIGLLHVWDYAVFWQGLASRASIAGERQISNGIHALMAQAELSAVTLSWTDVGDFAKYRQAVEQNAEYDFSKTNEFIYFVNGQVIKFFKDATIVATRTAKAALKLQVFPAIRHSVEQFYSYSFVAGKTLYARNHPDLFRSLLAWLQESVWTPVAVPDGHMQSLCRTFYQDKTQQRLHAYHRKYPDFLPLGRVNGEKVPPLEDLLRQLDWSALCHGVAVFMHGDLQFDNILHDEESGRFLLLDWRQDFGGEVAFGDIYYDLAKLMGGIILNYDYIKRGLFTVERVGDDMLVDFACRYNCAAYLDILDRFIVDAGFDLTKVRLLVALIYLNMSPLHHPPFDQALYALGTLYLSRCLQSGQLLT